MYAPPIIIAGLEVSNRQKGNAMTRFTLNYDTMSAELWEALAAAKERYHATEKILFTYATYNNIAGASHLYCDDCYAANVRALFDGCKGAHLYEEP